MELSGIPDSGHFMLKWEFIYIKRRPSKDAFVVIDGNAPMLCGYASNKILKFEDTEKVEQHGND